ncbi:MAG: DUF3006 domain-containing protein [Syntrophomonas sp.]
MQAFVDRFEGDFAVLEIEGKGSINVKRSEIAEEAKEGDVLQQIGGEWVVNERATLWRQNKLKFLMDEMWEK